MNIADRLALIEAEYNAIKKQYEAVKKEALTACMNAADDDMKATVEGDHFSLHFSLTATNTFKLERAIELGYITKAQADECKVGSTRQNLSVKIRAQVFA